TPMSVAATSRVHPDDDQGAMAPIAASGASTAPSAKPIPRLSPFVSKPLQRLEERFADFDPGEVFVDALRRDHLRHAQADDQRSEHGDDENQRDRRGAFDERDHSDETADEAAPGDEEAENAPLGVRLTQPDLER